MCILILLRGVFFSVFSTAILHGPKTSKSHKRSFLGALANAKFRAIGCQVFDFLLDRFIDRLVGVIFFASFECIAYCFDDVRFGLHSNKYV